MKATDKLNANAAIVLSTDKNNSLYFEQLATSFENADVSIICNNLDCSIKTWSTACVDMFGYTAEEIIGKDISILSPPQSTTNEKTVLHKTVDEKTIVNYESIRIKKNGDCFQAAIVISPLKNKAGEVIGVCNIIRDNTIEKELQETLNSANIAISLQQTEKEKRAAELVIANLELAFQNKEKNNRAAELLVANKELLYQNSEKEKRAAELLIANEELAFLNKQQQALFASIVNSSDDAMLSKTLDGVITSWNYGAEKIFGYKAGEIIGKM